MRAASGDGKAPLSSFRLCVFGEPPGFLAPFETAEGLQKSPLKNIIQNFQENLQSAFRVGSIPFKFAQSEQIQLLYQSILSAERIRQLIDEKSDQKREESARRIAQSRIEQELNDSNTVLVIAKKVRDVLDNHLKDRDFQDVSMELLYQMILISWGAFETLVDETCRKTINDCPKLAIKLINKSKFKDRFLNRDSIIKTFEEYDFDLSSRMGDLFCESVRLDSIENIKELSKFLFEDPNLDALLKSKTLWRTYQHRNLIAHRRGFIDKRFKDVVGGDLDLGTRICFESDYIETSITEIRDVGIAFASSAAARIERYRSA